MIGSGKKDMLWDGGKAVPVDGLVAPTASLHEISALLDSRISDAAEARAVLAGLHDRLYGPSPNAAAAITDNGPSGGALQSIRHQLDCLYNIQCDLRYLISRLEQLA